MLPRMHRYHLIMLVQCCYALKYLLLPILCTSQSDPADLFLLKVRGTCLRKENKRGLPGTKKKQRG